MKRATIPYYQRIGENRSAYNDPCISIQVVLRLTKTDFSPRVNTITFFALQAVACVISYVDFARASSSTPFAQQHDAFIAAQNTLAFKLYLCLLGAHIRNNMIMKNHQFEES